MLMLRMRTIFELEGTDTVFQYDGDFGKYLSTGDFVILHQHYFRIISKTYDEFEDKWIFVIEDAHSYTNPLLPIKKGETK